MLFLFSQDFFSFGALHRSQSNPSTNQNAYRFAFNRKEKSYRTGPQTNYDYSLSRIGGSFRIYNAGVARFLSVDPLTKSYPWYTPYQFAGNSPIKFIDLDGLEPAENPTNNKDVRAAKAEILTIASAAKSQDELENHPQNTTGLCGI